jgi:hypothetical protein
MGRFDPIRLAVLVALLAAGVFLWDTPWLLPFKLLAVMGHETGHALAALLVGGSVDTVSLTPNEAGQCLSRIPEGFVSKVIVYSAGYLGSALISVLLLLLTFRLDARRPMLWLGAAWLGTMGLLYARDGFTLAFCAGMALCFGLAARLLPAAGVGALNLFLASFTALYAAMDLKDDLWDGTVRVRSDAQLLANVTVVPAVVWAALWTALALALLLSGMALALRRDRVTRSPDAISGAASGARRRVRAG